MKKALLLMSVAGLALASCTEQDEAVRANEGQAIDFRPAMAALTRASETTNANLKSFDATALLGTSQYFRNITFSKGTGGFYTSQDNYYWPGDDSSLDFYAWSPSANELGAEITIDSQTKELTDFTVAEDIADQVDFITANASGNKKENESSGVELTFDHRLSQIELRAKTDNKTYVYKVAGMRIGRPQTTGSFNFADNTWTLDSWHDTFVYESSCTPVTLTSDAQNIMGESGNAMLLPQTLTAWDAVGDPDNVARQAYLSVLINITTADTGVRIYPFPTDTKKDENGNLREYAWASIPISGTWEQGKKYIYTLDFTDGAGNVDPDDPTPGKPVLGDPIKFTVQVNDWVDAPLPTPMTPVK